MKEFIIDLFQTIKWLLLEVIDPLYKLTKTNLLIMSEKDIFKGIIQEVFPTLLTILTIIGLIIKHKDKIKQKIFIYQVERKRRNEAKSRRF